MLLLAASPAAADTFTVTNGADSGAGSLRAALDAADTNDNGATVDQIDFTYTGNIDLDSFLPQVSTPLTINGPGAGVVTVRRNPSTVSGNFQLFPIVPGTGVTITIRGLTFSGGQAIGLTGGGLNMTGPGTLIVDSVVVKDNTSSQGGGLFYGNGFTSIRNSTFSGNVAAEAGGGILGTQVSVTDHGEAELVNSTVDDNHAVSFGGGIQLDASGHLRILSSTITRNEADSDSNGSGEGGGLVNNADDPDASDEFQIANTLLAGNFVGDSTGDAHCTGLFTSLGYNLREANDTGCSGFGAPGDFVNASPMIVTPPATNGGPTPNVALLAGSPAINAGNPAALGGAFPACPATDQRGLFRGGVAGNCDIGSYELNASSTPPSTGGGTTSPPPATLATTPTFNLAAAIKRCKKKFPRGPKRKKCIKRAKLRAQSA